MIATIIKTTVSTASSIGVGTMAAEVTKRLIPEGASIVTKVCCHTAGCVGAGFVGWKLSDYTDEFIDEIADLGKKAFKKTDK